MKKENGLVAHCKKTGKSNWEQEITNGPNGPEMVQAYHFNITSEFKVCITNFDGKSKGTVSIGDHTCQPIDIHIADEEAKEIYDHIKRIGVIDKYKKGEKCIVIKDYMKSDYVDVTTMAKDVLKNLQKDKIVIVKTSDNLLKEYFISCPNGESYKTSTLENIPNYMDRDNLIYHLNRIITK